MATLIDNAKREFTDVWHVLDPSEVSDWLAQQLQAEVSNIKEEYLENELFGLDMLIQNASGTPVMIEGTDKEIHLGMGPEDPEDPD